MEKTATLESEIALRTQKVNEFVEQYFLTMELPNIDSILELRNSMSYSANNGGKRFRPVLALLIAELFQVPHEKVLPFAAAVEMIHTYSLIHDDLPCMDNDDIRRGKPTNHKVYGEDFALLAGDALLTESFLVLANAYGDNAKVFPELIKLLSDAAGIRGMVGGQAIDLRAGRKQMTLAELTELHRLKTGALIRVSVEGAALISGADRDQTQNLRKFGEGLGLAFQVADDILDHGEKDQDLRSFTGLLGFNETKVYLDNLSKMISDLLHTVTDQFPLLEYLVWFNQNRSV